MTLRRAFGAWKLARAARARARETTLRPVLYQWVQLTAAACHHRARVPGAAQTAMKEVIAAVKRSLQAKALCAVARKRMIGLRLFQWRVSAGLQRRQRAEAEAKALVLQTRRAWGVWRAVFARVRDLTSASSTIATGFRRARARAALRAWTEMAQRKRLLSLLERAFTQQRLAARALFVWRGATLTVQAEDGARAEAAMALRERLDGKRAARAVAMLQRNARERHNGRAREAAADAMRAAALRHRHLSQWRKRTLRALAERDGDSDSDYGAAVRTHPGVLAMRTAALLTAGRPRARALARLEATVTEDDNSSTVENYENGVDSNESVMMAQSRLGNTNGYIAPAHSQYGGANNRSVAGRGPLGLSMLRSPSHALNNSTPHNNGNSSVANGRSNFNPALSALPDPAFASSAYNTHNTTNAHVKPSSNENVLSFSHSAHGHLLNGSQGIAPHSGALARELGAALPEPAVRRESRDRFPLSSANISSSNAMATSSAGLNGGGANSEFGLGLGSLRRLALAGARAATEAAPAAFVARSLSPHSTSSHGRSGTHSGPAVAAVLSSHPVAGSAAAALAADRNRGVAARADAIILRDYNSYGGNISNGDTDSAVVSIIAAADNNTVNVNAGPVSSSYRVKERVRENDRERKDAALGFVWPSPVAKGGSAAALARITAGDAAAGGSAIMTTPVRAVRGSVFAGHLHGQVSPVFAPVGAHAHAHNALAWAVQRQRGHGTNASVDDDVEDANDPIYNDHPYQVDGHHGHEVGDKHISVGPSGHEECEHDRDRDRDREGEGEQTLLPIVAETHTQRSHTQTPPRGPGRAGNSANGAPVDRTLMLEDLTMGQL